jgi:hypothetical protein
MVHYNGTWYWGIDRLPYLEAALASDLGVTAAPVVVPRPESERGPLKLSDKPLTCELWFSFRSPYSYLALERIEEVLAPYGVPLVPKPIAPMVTRGLPVPAVKRMYIVRDAKREADRLGIPFGELCDPLGTGHCLAIAHWADKRGAGLPFAPPRCAASGPGPDVSGTSISRGRRARRPAVAGPEALPTPTPPGRAATRPISRWSACGACRRSGSATSSRGARSATAAGRPAAPPALATA